MPPDSTGRLRSREQNKPPPWKAGRGLGISLPTKTNFNFIGWHPESLRPNSSGNHWRRDFLFTASGWRLLWVSWGPSEGLIGWEASKDRPAIQRAPRGSWGLWKLSPAAETPWWPLAGRLSCRIEAWGWSKYGPLLPTLGKTQATAGQHEISGSH